MKLGRSPRVDPAKGILQVLDNRRKEHLGGQTVVDRDQNVVVCLRELDDIFRHAVTVAHDQRAAVNPNDRGPRLRAIAAIDIRLDLGRADGLVDERLLGPGGLVGGPRHSARAGGKQNDNRESCGEHS